MELIGIIKLLRSLQNKKIRQEKGLFIIEGDKMVRELLLSRIRTRVIAATGAWLKNMAPSIPQHIECKELRPEELKKASSLTTPNMVIAIAEIPPDHFVLKHIIGKLALMLDEVQDPGNLGTIIRLSDWFGIDTIICSKGTVDAYNPKVVQASMGSILRINIHYAEAVPFLEVYTAQTKEPVYGAFIDGANLYSTEIASHGLLVMGNESTGISAEVGRFVNHKICVPRSPAAGAESLNVAIATAILCAEFRRRRRE